RPEFALGIGDISWSYSKVADLGEELNIQISADNPKRSLDYVKLLPHAIKAEYTSENFHSIADNSIPPTTKKQDFLDVARKTFVNFSPNKYLEAGNRLETWIPELPTNFHYKMNLFDEKDNIVSELTNTSARYIGIYASSYQNVVHWNGWHLSEWAAAIHKIHSELPSVTFVLLGAAYDKPFADDLSKLISLVPHINLAGRTSCNMVIRIISILSYLISYPSGLAVMATIVSTPVMMFYPAFLWKIFNTWCDPKSLDDLTYKGCIFPKVTEMTDWLFQEYKLQDKI
ncbi:unnamed protein product, partial [marine sediment metagenome]